MIDSERFIRLKELLDQQHSWPGPYVFKFIVPGQKTEELQEVVQLSASYCRSSATGKYSSMTFEKHCESSEEVIDLYQRVSKIKGIVTL